MKKQTFGKTALSLAIALSVGSIATQAIAQNTVIEKTSVVSEKTTGSLIEIGTPQKLSNLKGFAKDLPMIAVLKQITPNEWVVKKAKGRSLDLQKSVSWTGGKNWVETLKDVSEANNIEALVNWDKKEVILAEVEIKAPVAVSTPKVDINKVYTTTATAKATQTVGIFELSTDLVTEGKSEQAEPVAVAVKADTLVINEVPAVPVVKTWSYEGMDNLKEVVMYWGKKSGYKVVYTGENYPLDKEDSRLFSGEFDAEDGPIKQLSIDYGVQSRVKKHLSFIFFQNKTLVVEDLRYEQSGYPQYIQK